MRIGIDARMYSSAFTGIGRYNFELIQNLFKIDPKNEYVIFLNAQEFDKFKIPRPGVTKICADIRHYSWQEQFLFPRILKKAELNLMHFTHFNGPIFYFDPSVITIHDLTLSFFPGKKMTSLLHRLAYQLTVRINTLKAKKIIAVSANTKKDLMKLLHLPAAKISVIYEGADPKFQKLSAAALQPIQKKYQLNNPFLLYTGVWRDHKNIVGLIKAYHQLVQKQHFEADLVITGKKDPTYQEVEEIIQTLNLQSRVKLLGLVPEEDLIALYNLAKVYVFPSFYEGFGLPPLEAMACGTPVCASDASSIPEICGTGNAVFFSPYDIAKMADAISRVYFDENLRQKLIQNGYNHIKNFSWEKMARETLAVYESVY